MAKRYLVIIPVNKEAYMKSLNSPEKAASIIRDKLGSLIKEDAVEGFDTQMTMFSACGRKKAELGVNDRATYYAALPSAEDDIFGTAVIIGKNENGIVGLTEEKAVEVKNAVNGLRV
jgi:hypothetical protein